MTPQRCPCGTGLPYDGCCGRLHAGGRAATAEQLMRSRYSAFAVGDAAYLLRTWHDRTRPATLELDATLTWHRLDVVVVERGGPFDDDGVVTFVAHHRGADGPGELHGRSRFVRERGEWFYVDG